MDLYAQQDERIVQSVGARFPLLGPFVRPRFEELRRRFPGYLNPAYREKHFVPTALCHDVALGSVERIFQYVYLGREAYLEEILQEIERQGLRPATFEELLAFAERYPQEQLKYLIAALGSEATDIDHRCFAYVHKMRNGARLGLNLAILPWAPKSQFLATPKEPSQLSSPV